MTFEFSLGNFYLCIFSCAAMLSAIGFNWPLVAAGIAWCITLAGSWVKELQPKPRPRAILGTAIVAAFFIGVSQIISVFGSMFAAALLVTFAHRLMFG